MATKSEITFPTYKPVHPGVVLREELKERGIKQKDFALAIGMRSNHVSELLGGKRSISPAVAQKIELELGIPAIDMLTMQQQFEYDTKVLQARSLEERSANIALAEYNELFDVKILLKRLNIVCASSKETLAAISQTLHLTTPAELKALSIGYFSKSEKTGTDRRMLLTWVLIAQAIMSSIKPVGGFYESCENELTKSLALVFNENVNTISRVESLLSQYGIAFAVVHKVEKASIDGYSFIDNSGKPCIVVTLRYNRIDNFAFSVMHELAHLFNHLSQGGSSYTHINIEDYRRCDKEEREADAYAANALIPNELWRRIPLVRPNLMTMQRVYTQWALENGLNKWIVLGRISHEFNMYRFFDKGSTRSIK